MIYVIIINLRVVANLFCVTQKEMFCKTSMLHKNYKRNEWTKPFKSLGSVIFFIFLMETLMLIKAVFIWSNKMKK